MDKIKKEVKKFEDLMDPIKWYVYGELNGELCNEFMSKRMNIINVAN